MKRGVFPLFSVFTKLCLSCRQKPITPDSIKFVIRTNEQSFFTMFCLHEKDFNTAPDPTVRFKHNSARGMQFLIKCECRIGDSAAIKDKNQCQKGIEK